MDSIDSIFAKRQMIEDLRLKSTKIPISNEAEHATIFNRIWRLNNEIKALENAVNNGVVYSIDSNHYQTYSIQTIHRNQTQNLTQDPTQDDMGDDFTAIPVEPVMSTVKQTHIINQNLDKILPLDDSQRKINGILFAIEMLEKMPSTRETTREIETLQNLLSRLV